MEQENLQKISAEEKKLAKKNNYVDKKEFEMLIHEYYQLLDDYEQSVINYFKKIGQKYEKNVTQIPEIVKSEEPDIPEKLGECVFKISTGLGYAPNFINYHNYKSDFIGDAVLKMIKALQERKYDLSRGNPFSYFTTIAYNAFVNRIKKEKKVRDTLTEFQEKTYSETMCEEGNGKVYVRANHDDHLAE